MATTYFKPHHISKGETIAQSMKDRFDYGQNPEKTQGGDLVLAYECDPKTADGEFLLSKAKYKAVTGREQKKDEDILCYQVRQSFVPGEVDSETALKIGYDFAMRWTKGRHAFFVVSHVDRPHPHVHIYYNSTTLDCTRKFRDFLGTARAVRRLSDRICLENSLSYIASPKLKSKGKYRHYGQWLGGNKTPTFQERLKAQIDICLAEKPPDMDRFLQAMFAAGFEVKHRRGGGISFRTEGQERFTQLRAATLGKGYGLEDIQAAIKGRAAPMERRKVNLIVDIQSRMRAGKGPAYEQWAKIYNLKQMAAALPYLQENGLMDYADLEQKATQVADRFHTLSDSIKSMETAMRTNTELKVAVVDYAKTRPVFEGYKAAKYSRKYLAEHEADIAAYRAARATMDRLLNGAKLPKMDTLKAEFQQLASDKKKAYREYREAKKAMQEIVTVKSNIDHLLGLTDAQKNKEMER
ncbi:relaxase/mobilization nuclease domain-containing protein [Paenibacillus sp. HN-1]|uniref:relaxase/mobilization nuclease domain-containing protein n=1 Tax=Paenibacillus TaxID=44249 RepID=UPI001CA7F528|nr:MULTISPECIES: relaxase/mobilization nuclease domain-containing protein [Paenibacillus]MBY9077770.1 relaxase/mobilization nuclease domain-containing protein [Paenibacillus sp. CGMCC 1.18879]MBY9088274.1 relaxase/mobilization nuclease domain-containing protein [Paenibacillus sinensis]